MNWGKKLCKVASFLMLILCGMLLSEGKVCAANMAKDAVLQESGKIISVVYDDSYSMSEDGSTKWAYANYALQLLSSAIKDQDDIYLTRMSAYNDVTVLNADNDYQQSVDWIRNTFSNKGTMFASVKAAFDNMTILDNVDADVEYWMVIFSDGRFYEAGGGREISGKELEKQLYEYAETVMPNGTSPHIVYVAVGETADRLSNSTVDNLYYLYADSNEEIVEQAEKICTMICGRTSARESELLQMEQIGENRIKVTSQIKLKDFCILSQNSQAMVEHVVNQDGTKIDIGRNVNVRYPIQLGYQTDTSLNGNITVLEEGKCLEAGTYYITYDEPVNIQSLDVFVTPGFAIRPVLRYEGTKEPIEDLSQIYDTDRICADYEVFDRDTGNLISKKEVKDCLFSVYADGKLMDRSYDNLRNMKLTNSLHVLKVKAKVKGFELTSSLSFQPEEYLTYRIVPIEERSVKTIKKENLCGNKESVYYQVFANGRALTRTEMKNLPFEIKTREKYGNIDFDVELCPDGVIKVTPYYLTDNKWMALFCDWLPYYLYITDEMPVVCSVYSEYEDADVEGSVLIEVTKSSRAWTLFQIIKPWIILVLIAGFMFKARFSKKYEVCIIRLEAFQNKYISKENQWSYKNLVHGSDKWFAITSGWSLVPFVSNRFTFGGLQFCAQGFWWQSSSKKKIRIKTGRKAWIKSLWVASDTIRSDDYVELRMNSSRILRNDLMCRKLVMKYRQAVLVETSEGEYLFCKMRKRIR